MFLVVLVCSQGGAHVTITHDAFELTAEAPHPCSLTWDLMDPPLQTWALRDPHGADIWWLLKQVWSAQVGSTHPTAMPVMLSCCVMSLV